MAVFVRSCMPFWVVCALLLSMAAVANANPPPKRSPAPEDILPQSELDDPIGVDSDSRTLDSAVPPPAKPTPDQEHARERFGPEPPKTAARAGEVLTAAAAVREQAHTVEVELAPGFTRVRVLMRFESRTDTPSELRYRLAVPDGGQLAALEVCNAHGCRPGVPAPAGGARAYAAALLARGPAGARLLPIARGRDTRDARGAAIVVNAAPVLQALPLELRVSYLVPVELHGGVVRLRFPARGMDPQVAPAELRLSAPGLIDARAAGAPAADGQPAAGVDPWSEVEVSARAKSGDGMHVDVRHFPCAGGGARRCGFAHAWAGPRPSTPVDLVIALDVSPSTEGEARGRLLPTIAGLLSVLPEGSRVRALAFAARAQPLVEQPLEPSRVALAPFDRAIAQVELGSATRFEAAWQLIAGWLEPRKQRRLRPLVAIVGDGGLTVGEARPFDRARAAGVEVSAINAADRPTPDALRAGVARTGGIAVHLAGEAETAARGRDPSALHDKLSALFAPALAQTVSVLPGGARVELGALRAGEQRSFRGPLRGGGLRMLIGARSVAGRAAERGLTLGLGSDARAASGQPAATSELVAVDARDLRAADQGWPEPAPPRSPCDRRGPARRLSGVSSDAQPVATAEEHVCKAPEKASGGAGAAPGRGMPADPLLSMLRLRILPIARGCFRRDRAGRAEYRKRAVFAFTLAEREIVDARVEGAIPAALKACLMAAVDTLEVPRFTGTVRVRYPLVTESVPLPDQIELQAGTAGEIDRLFGHSPTR